MEVIGMLAWQPFKKAYLGAIQEDDKIWQLAGQELFDVKVVIDRLWVSPCMRRKLYSKYDMLKLDIAILVNLTFTQKIKQE